jgi:hypothetical protein
MCGKTSEANWCINATYVRVDCNCCMLQAVTDDTETYTFVFHVFMLSKYLETQIYLVSSELLGPLSILSTTSDPPLFIRDVLSH